jgi:hypothetical protein
MQSQFHRKRNRTTAVNNHDTTAEGFVTGVQVLLSISATAGDSRTLISF